MYKYLCKVGGDWVPDQFHTLQVGSSSLQQRRHRKQTGLLHGIKTVLSGLYSHSHSHTHIPILTFPYSHNFVPRPNPQMWAGYDRLAKSQLHTATWCHMITVFRTACEIQCGCKNGHLGVWKCEYGPLCIAMATMVMTTPPHTVATHSARSSHHSIQRQLAQCRDEVLETTV